MTMKPALLLVPMLALSGCSLLDTLPSAPKGISSHSRDALVAKQWAGKDNTARLVADNFTSWLAQLGPADMLAQIQLGLANNPSLKAQQAVVEQARLAWQARQGAQWPGLSLSAASSRRDSGTAVSNSNELTASFDWQLDIWGELADASRQSALQLAASEFDYLQQRQQLAVDIASAYLDLHNSQQLLELYGKRKDNLQSQLENIEEAYKRGISQAPEVYLARNNLASEQARFQAELQTRADRARRLQLLTGQYPSGQLKLAKFTIADSELPPAGIPSQLLSQRADLNSLWLGLLAQDSAIAVAYKRRFPQFSIRATLGSSQQQLSDLFSANPLWSLALNASQSLFDGGQLKAQQQQSQARRDELEQRYLASLNQAFSEVEAALANQSTLSAQYQSYLRAYEQAALAEATSLQRYRAGLDSFSGFLEAQRRKFDAQTQQLQLENRLAQNRLALQHALGGPLPNSTQSQPNDE